MNNPSASAANAAYSGRGQLWIVQHYAILASQGSSDTERAINFVNGLNDALKNSMPGTGFGGYLNYVDPELSAQEAHGLYYGNDVYQRLVEIKKVVDPDNVFSNPQSVGN